MDAIMAQLLDWQKQEQALTALLSALSKPASEDGIAPEDAWRTPGLSLVLVGLIVQSYQHMERVTDAEECLPQLQRLMNLLVSLSSSKTVAESFIDSSLVTILFPYLQLPYTPYSIKMSILLVCTNVANTDDGPSYLIGAGILPLILPLLAGKSFEGLFICSNTLLYTLISAVAANPTNFNDILPQEKLATLVELLIEVLIRLRPEGNRDWLVSYSSLRTLLLTLAALKGVSGLKGSTSKISRFRKLCSTIKDTDGELSAALKALLSSE